MVSVIVPVYNVETLLPRCVDSILSQSYKEIEIFLVDDGSRDKSGEICDEYATKDARIRVMHQANAGQAVARNAALDIACGEYVIFVDSDDYILPDMISEMVRCAEEYKASVVICGAMYDNGRGDTRVLCPYESPMIFRDYTVLKEYFTPKRIQTAPWGKLFRRELFNNIRFPAYRAREDYAIMHELLGSCETAVHIGKAFYVQYVRPGSTEYSPFKESKLAVIECDKAIIKYVKEKYPHLYHMVVTNYADALRNCMADICSSFARIKYRKIFNSLREQLGYEIERLAAEGCSIPLDTHRFAADHPHLFSLKEHKNGAVRFVKRTVKRILYGKKH